MKKQLLFLFFLLSLFSWQVNAQCNYTLEMNDSYGDGWNGNTMDVLVNGNVVLDDVTLNDGYQGSLQFQVNTGDDISTVWNGGGNYVTETSYRILDSEGVEVASAAHTDIPSGSLIASCPTCPKPSDLQVNNVTITTVDLSWVDHTGGASYIIEWREQGATSWNNATATAGATSYQLTGLSVHTPYEWQLTADCGGGDMSNTVTGEIFWTACAIVDAFPYNYGFEDAPSNSNADWRPSCWSANPQNINSTSFSGPYRWTSDNANTPSSNTGPSAAHTGMQYAYTEASGSGTGDVAELISPVFDMSSLSTPQLVFYYYMYGQDMGELHVDTYNGTSWTNDVWSMVGEQQTAVSDPWYKTYIDLSNDVTQIRFRAIRGAGYRSDIAIDDISITEAVSCPEPYALTLENITSTTAEISWREGANATTWNIEYGTAGFTHGNGTSVQVTDTSYILSGLNSNQAYDVYVQSDCGGGDASEWIGPLTLTYHLVYVPDDNFETYLETHDGYGNEVPIGDPNSMGNGVSNDDYVLAAKIQDVTYLNITNQDISDLTGIEEFENLKILNASYNHITGADFSANLNLTRINIEYNNLTSINVSANADLNFLYAYHNALDAVDVSNNSALERLGLSNNNLTTIDVSNNTNLILLDVHSNDLSVLDVSNNPALVYLYAYDNNLSLLDLSNNPELMRLGISDNHLTSLDLTQNANLNTLYVQNNDLNSLNIQNGNNTAITNSHFIALNNPDLTCIFVDDANWSTNNWLNIDTPAHFVETQAECDAICNTPSNLTVSNIQTYSADVSWTDNNAGGASYLIQWREAGSSTWNYYTTAVGDTTYQLTGLNPSTTYEWQLSSDCGAGIMSNAVLGTNFTTLSTCPDPSDLSVSFNGTIADLSWTDNTSGNAAYLVQWRSTGATVWNSHTTAPGDTSYQINGLVIGEEYEWQLTADCGGGDASQVVGPVSFVVPPVNDTCAGAISVACGDVVSGSTVNATSEVIGAFTGTNENAKSVWYVFTGTGDAVTLSVCEDNGATPGTAAYDSKIDVYAGDCNNLVHIGGNDDGNACSNFSSLFEFTSNQGTNYYIRVYGYSSYSAGDFVLSVECTPPCSPVATNDDCSGSESLTFGVETTGDNTCQTQALTNPVCDSYSNIYDVWYDFTTDANTTEVALTFNFEDSTFTAEYLRYAVYTDCSLSNSILCSSYVTPGAENILSGLTPNTNYKVQVWSDVKGTFGIKVQSTYCADPTALSVDNVSQTTADLSWTDNTGGNAAYTIYWRETGSGWNTATTAVGDSSYQLTGLTEATEYEWMIVSDCNVSNGHNVLGNNFTTLCSAPAANPVPDLTNLPDINAQCSVDLLPLPTATSNCGETVYGTYDVTLPIIDQGTTVVTWTYDDGYGNVTTQTQNVVIADVTDPVPDVANLPDVTAECEVTNITPPTATDNCSGVITATPDVTFPIADQGTTVVTWTYDDGNGNIVTQTQNVVIADVTAPVPDVANLPDITAECEVTSLTPPTATDNCSGVITATGDAVLPITTQGTTVVTWTYDDGNGNVITQTQNIVIADVTPPVPDMATLPDLIAECEISAIVPPTATDNCSGQITATGDVVLPITTQGTTVITWTYDDGNGNITTQTQNVILDDLTAPTPDVDILPDITAECEVTSLTPPTATDTCTGAITGTTDTQLPITQQGTTVVTWTYDDGNGNIYQQTQLVVINDVTPPVPDVANLPDVTDECEVTSLTPPTATDTCSSNVTVTNDAVFPITQQGTTVVTWTYDDGNGNITTQTQNVIIQDVTIPVPDAATLPDVLAECEVSTLTPPTATDNCAGVINGTPDVSLPITTQGTTVVTWTYDDGNGNTITQTQNVIIDDVTAPVPVSASLPDVVSECEIDALTAPEAIDNCAGTIQATPDVSLPITTPGTIVVTWTYDDANGNTITQTQNVTYTPIDNTITQNNNVLFANAVGANYTYQWVTCTSGGNDPIPGATGQSYTPVYSGDYAVIVSNGTCSVTSDCINVTVTGIIEAEMEGLKIYPNPSTGLFNVELQKFDHTSVRIFDMTGKLILSKELHQVKTTVDIQKFAKGVYVMQIQKAEKVYNISIVKE